MSTSRLTWTLLLSRTGSNSQLLRIGGSRLLLPAGSGRAGVDLARLRDENLHPDLTSVLRGETGFRSSSQCAEQCRGSPGIPIALADSPGTVVPLRCFESPRSPFGQDHAECQDLPLACREHQAAAGCLSPLLGGKHQSTLIGRRSQWPGLLDRRYRERVSRLERITTDPAVCHGQPTIRGLRYTVESVLELLSAGMTIDEVLAEYPDLEREDIFAALEFGARAAGRRRVVPLSAA